MLVYLSLFPDFFMVQWGIIVSFGGNYFFYDKFYSIYFLASYVPLSPRHGFIVKNDSCRKNLGSFIYPMMEPTNREWYSPQEHHQLAEDSEEQFVKKAEKKKSRAPKNSTSKSFFYPPRTIGKKFTCDRLDSFVIGTTAGSTNFP